MKACKFCGRELDDEANFCPFCMRKQNIPEAAPVAPHKRSKTVIIIVVSAVAAAALAAGAFFLFKFKPWEKSDPKPAATSSSASSSEQKEDYSSYEGVWEAYNGGSTVLTIESIKDNKITFTLVKNSSGTDRFARIEHIEADIKDGVASFRFSEDGWGNGGSGKIVFGNDYVVVQTEIDVVTDAWYNWDISMEPTQLSRRNLINISLESTNYLTRQFSEVQNDFGYCISENTEYSPVTDLTYTHYEYSNGISVSVSDGTIQGFTIDYGIADNKSQCNYKGVDGNSGYDDVVKKIGSPLDVYPEDNCNVLGYGVKNGFMKIYIDNNTGKVSQIVQFIPI